MKGKAKTGATLHQRIIGAFAETALGGSNHAGNGLAHRTCGQSLVAVIPPRSCKAASAAVLVMWPRALEGPQRDRVCKPGQHSASSRHRRCEGHAVASIGSAGSVVRCIGLSNNGLQQTRPAPWHQLGAVLAAEPGVRPT